MLVRMSLRLSVHNKKCTLDFPEKIFKEYFSKKKKNYPENGFKRLLFTNATESNAWKVLEAAYGDPNLILAAIFSKIKTLALEASTSVDMESCIAIMKQLFYCFSKSLRGGYLSNAAHVQDHIMPSFALDITKCENISIKSYGQLMEFVEDPEDFDFLGKVTLRIPGRPLGQPPAKEDRVIIGYPVCKLIVENLGGGFSFSDWFVVDPFTMLRHLSLSYGLREPRTIARLNTILTPYFADVTTFQKLESLSLSNLRLKVQDVKKDKKELCRAGWELPKLKDFKLSYVGIIDERTNKSQALVKFNSSVNCKFERGSDEAKNIFSQAD